jgi:hypothetical protein
VRRHDVNGDGRALIPGKSIHRIYRRILARWGRSFKDATRRRRGIHNRGAGSEFCVGPTA